MNGSDVLQLRDECLDPRASFRAIWTLNSMSKFILDVSCSMSVKLDECHVERHVEVCLPCGIELAFIIELSLERIEPGRCLHRTWIVLTFLCGKRGSIS